MAPNDEFDREIKEITRSFVRGELSRNEFEIQKKDIAARYLKRAYEKKKELETIPNKLSRGNKGLLLLLVLFIASLSTYALVSNFQYQVPLDSSSNEEESIIEKIVSIPSTIMGELPASKISPIDKALRDDKSRHTFTQTEFNSISNKIVSDLPLPSMRGMGMNNFSLDGAAGVVDISIVKEGYVIYPSKSSGGSEVYITLFLVEPGKQNKFFRELSTYIGSFDSLRKGYKKERDVVSTEFSFVQCRYSLTENSNKYPVSVTSFKASNMAGFIYYLDSKGEFSLQREIETGIKSVLNSYE
ncbi:MAG TPA: hypothetical protein PLU96_07345 [Methanofastidiosum sp.]|jgi:hypothetical protein|nr:hypothetical protein [Methanofastidiosum sp.]